jgi:hypothetical protein
LAPPVGQHSQFLQGQAVEAHGLLRADAPALPDFVQQLVCWQFAVHINDDL